MFLHLWNDEADPFSHVIRVQVYSLKKELTEVTHRKDMIVTYADKTDDLLILRWNENPNMLLARQKEIANGHDSIYR